MFAPAGDAWSFSGADAYVRDIRSESRPADLIMLIAEVQAGQTVDPAGREVPLVRDELMNRWRRLHAVPPALNDVPGHWLRTRAYEAGRSGRWAVVIDTLGHLRQRGPLAWTDSMRLLNAYGAVKRWAPALALVRALGTSVDNAPELAEVEAVASLHVGARDHVDRLCQRLVERFAATQNTARAAAVVRVCLLAPGDHDVRWPQIDSLAQRTLLPARRGEGVGAWRARLAAALFAPLRSDGRSSGPLGAWTLAQSEALRSHRLLPPQVRQ
jgi:hypothetical protein